MYKFPVVASMHRFTGSFCMRPSLSNGMVVRALKIDL
jgi:hypothetical protein